MGGFDFRKDNDVVETWQNNPVQKRPSFEASRKPINKGTLTGPTVVSALLWAKQQYEEDRASVRQQHLEEEKKPGASQCRDINGAYGLKYVAFVSGGTLSIAHIDDYYWIDFVADGDGGALSIGGQYQWDGPDCARLTSIKVENRIQNSWKFTLMMNHLSVEHLPKQMKDLVCTLNKGYSWK